MVNTRFLFLIFLIFTSCSTNNEKQGIPNLQHPKVDSPGKSNNVLVKTDNRDTLIIDKKAAVFYPPDTIQMAKRSNEVGEENFRIGVDDYLFSMHVSYDFLDSVKLPILDAKDKKYLKFVNDNNSSTTIKLDTLPELWGIYFFRPGKKVKLIDMTVVDVEYNSYFK